MADQKNDDEQNEKILRWRVMENDSGDGKREAIEKRK